MIEEIYPALKERVSEARLAGYSEEEIVGAIRAKIGEARKAGYSVEEINKELGVQGPTTMESLVSGPVGDVITAGLEAPFIPPALLLGSLAGGPKEGLKWAEETIRGRSEAPAERYSRAVTGKPLTELVGRWPALGVNIATGMTPLPGPKRLFGMRSSQGVRPPTPTGPIPAQAVAQPAVVPSMVQTAPVAGPAPELVQSALAKPAFLRTAEDLNMINASGLRGRIEAIEARAAQAKMKEPFTRDANDLLAIQQERQMKGVTSPLEVLAQPEVQEAKVAAKVPGKPLMESGQVDEATAVNSLIETTDLIKNIPAEMNKLVDQALTTRIALREKTTGHVYLGGGETHGGMLSRLAMDPNVVEGGWVVNKKFYTNPTEAKRALEANNLPKTPPGKETRMSIADHEAMESNSLLYGGGPSTQQIGQAAKATVQGLGRALDFVDRQIGSPNFVLRLKKDPMAWKAWEELYEGVRQEALFKNAEYGKFSKSVGKVKPWTDADFSAGKFFDGQTDVVAAEAQTLKSYWLEARDRLARVLVGIGRIKPEEVQKAYFPRRWHLTHDLGQWAKATREEIATLEAKRVAGTLAEGEASQLTAARNALEAFYQSNEARVTFDFVPKKFWAPFLMERKGVKGYDLSAVSAIHKYINEFGRSVYLEPHIQKALQLTREIQDPLLQKYFYRLAQRAMNADKRWSDGLDRVTRVMANLEYIKDIGFSIPTAIYNATQPISAIVDLGVKGPFYLGKAIYHSRAPLPQFGKTGLELFAESGHIADMPWMYNYLRSTGSIAMPTAGKTFERAVQNVGDAAGWIYNKVEFGNRYLSYVGGILKGLDQGLSIDAAKALGDATVRRTQFLYGPAGSSMMATNPIGRLAMQFASFPIKQMELFRTWGREGAAGWVKLISYLVITDQLLGQGLKHFGIDLSNALGLGFQWSELPKALKELFSGKDEEAKAHAKAFISSIYSGTGGGIFPVGLLPIKDTLQSMVTGDFYRMIPLEAHRVMDTVKGFMHGSEVDPDTQQKTYPLLGQVGSPSSQHIRSRLSTGELISHAVGPKPYAETKIRYEEIKDKISAQAIQNATRKAVDFYLKGDETRALELAQRFGLTNLDESVEQEMMARRFSREEIRRMKEGTIGSYRRHKLFPEEGSVFSAEIP